MQGKNNGMRKMNLNDVENHIGKQIKMLRLSRKITQRDLAEQMSVTYQQIQKYENGLNKISVSRLWQVCEIFQITPDALFEGILTDSEGSHSPGALIPNKVATSQDIKLMLAFKNVESTANRSLIIKLCEAMGGA